MVVDGRSQLVLFGGQDLRYLVASSNLVVLKEVPRGRSSKPSFDCTIVESPYQNEATISKDLQKGDIPEARFGHSMTMVDKSHAILHGGVTMANKYRPAEKSRGAVPLPRPFLTSCEDGHFYLLNVETYTWEKLRVPQLPGRAYHTSTLHNNNIYIIGGASYTGNIQTHRLSLHDINILHIDNLHRRQFHLTCMQFTHPIVTPVHLSYHSAFCTQIIFVCVRWIQNSMHAVEAQKSIFKTAGHNMLKLDDKCIMLCGGTTKHIFYFTSKHISTDPCDLADECIIAEVALEGDIVWVQCEGRCEKWYHMYCLKLVSVPSGKFVCPRCR
ncbi:uncharacterized protein [Amphiura filiformis]|uniref:uncharacterized protein n=1 Tax=Amphiura filiformis TaxID=82378 RepID=UPI003B21B3D5